MVSVSRESALTQPAPIDMASRKGPEAKKDKGSIKKALFVYRRAIESKVYKEVNFGTTVTNKSFNLGKTVRNFCGKFRDLFISPSSTSQVIGEAVNTGEEISHAKVLSNWLLRATRWLFIFKVPKTLYEFIEHSKELSKHKESKRGYETCQASLGIVDCTGDLMGVAADAGSAMAAFNLINEATLGWAGPVSLVGALFKGADVVANGLQFHETCNFYKKMQQLTGNKKQYSVDDFCTLTTFIKKQEDKRSERFLKRQFSVKPLQFKSQLELIRHTVEKATQSSDSGKVEEAKGVADQVTKNLKKRVSIRMTKNIFNIVSGIMGVFASVFLAALTLGAMYIAAPVMIALTLACLFLMINSLGFTIARMIYEHVSNKRVQRVFDETVDWAKQTNLQQIREQMEKNPLLV